MIQRLNHIAIICSSMSSVAFYEALGFEVTSKIIRAEAHDTVITMEGNGVFLKIFIDSTHPARVTNPEAYGLRHLAFAVKDLEKCIHRLERYKPEAIKKDLSGKSFTFVKDPDGQPFELREE